MAALTQRQKEFIVTQLACFASPSEVAEEAEAEFPGLKLTRQQVARYNPDRATGAELSPELAALFAARRAQFLKERESIAITHKNFRARELDALYHRNRNNPVLAMKILEQAAKEAGGMYEKKATEAQGGEQGGGADFRDLSDAELNGRLAEFEAAIEKVYGAQNEGEESA